MIELVATAASIGAISTLAFKTYQSLNNLLHDVATAPDYLVVLRSQVLTFALALRHLDSYLKAAALPESRVKELRDAIRGGEPIIQQLYQHLSSIKVEEVRGPNGQNILKSPRWDRLQLQLEEGRIHKWSNSLSAHCGPLTLLLKTQELDEIAAAVHLDGDFDDRNEQPGSLAPPASRTTTQSTLIGDGDPTDEWVALGKQFEPDSSVAPQPKIPTKKSTFSMGSVFKNKANKISKKVKDSSVDLRENYRRMLSAQSKELGIPRLRVVVLGRTGAGKSKLSASVFGLPYLDDGFDGKKTPPEQIWKQVSDPNMRKRKIALHDSGGMEGAKTIEAVKSYLEHMQKTSKLEDQIHAIWYVIPCRDAFRAVQETDELFLSGELFDTGEIPIFVIYTQYDLLAQFVRKKLGSEAPEQAVRELTHEHFQRQIESKALAAVKDKSKFSFCRVGFYDDGTEYVSPPDGGPAFGIEQLVRQVEDRLENGLLQIQWVAIQQKDDQTKLYDSITTNVALLWTARHVAMFSYLPFVCLIGLDSIYASIINVAANFWQIDDWTESISQRVLRAIFDLSRVDLFFRDMALLCNVFGKWSVSLISTITLKMIVGVNLIGRSIFLLQCRNKKRRLTQQQIVGEISAFQASDDRKRMADVITSARMAEIDYKKKDRVDHVSKVAKEALEAAVGFVDAAFFEGERLRVIKQLGAIEVAQDEM